MKIFYNAPTERWASGQAMPSANRSVQPLPVNIKNLFLGVKLAVLLVLTTCLQVSAKVADAQKLSISFHNGSLEKLFAEIEKKTPYVFFYDASILKEVQPVTIEIKDASVEQVLNQALKGLSLDYSITNNTIFIKKHNKNVVEINDEHNPPVLVKAKGLVFNESGQPLSGASIKLKQTGKFIITNPKGEFEFSGVPVNSILVVSFVGYSSKQVMIQNQDLLRIYLSVAVNEMDQVVIQGYGTTTRRLTTSDIGKVTSEEIEKQPVMNPLLALQGKVAGLDVVQTNGYASAPIKVELRGRSSINSAFPSDPLYIIDGVPLNVLEVGGNSNYLNGSTGFLQSGVNNPAGGQSPLFSINPNDIESIEVLKDASATAIYGSRGANGVILITTKKGKPGKTALDIHVEEGVDRVTKYWPLLNREQYLTMRREAFKNDNITPDQGSAPDLTVWDTSTYTNWQRAFFGGVGKAINTQLGLSGGDNFNTFHLGAGYSHLTNILRVSGADQRASVTFNFSHASSDQKFNISLTGSYTYTQSDMISLPGSSILPPNAPPIYDSAGNLNYEGWAPIRYAYPFASLKQPYTSKTNFLNSSLFLHYKPVKGLDIGANFGYNNAQANQLAFFPILSQDPQQNPTGVAEFGNNNNKNWNIEPQINYNLVLGRSKFAILAGASYQHTATDGINIAGGGYTSDALLHTISNAPYQHTTDSYGEYKYAAVFGRIAYNFENQYILEFSARRDGSSKFGANKQYGNFGSIGAAWIFTEQDWVHRNLAIISFGKIRASYGITGSDGVSDYQYLTRWSSNGLSTYGNVVPLASIQHANPNYEWQANHKLELAIDWGFLKDRITISTAYYRNRVGNQLLSIPLPVLTGFGGVTANSPALVQNSGMEFTVGAKIINSKTFTWSLNFNTSINKNKLLSYPNLDQSPYANTYVIGKPLNIIKLLQYTGVDPQTGLYTYRDKNHDGVISTNFNSPTNDLYNYDLSPKWFGGVSTNFTYKSIQLYLSFNIRKQIALNGYYQYAGHPINISTDQFDRWQKPGDHARFAKFSTQGGDSYDEFSSSDGAYTDASFIRLSVLSFSYDLPKTVLRHTGLESCNIFFHTNNLFVITKYKGLDPETHNVGGMPPSKTLVGGISFNF